MQGVISVTPEQLRQQARVYLDARQMIDDAKNKVNNMNSEIAHQWRGKAFDAYLLQYEQLAGHIVEFENLLESINQQLIKYADTQEARDAEDVHVFGLN